MMQQTDTSLEKAENRGLIKPTPQDALVARVENFRRQNENWRQKERLAEAARAFVRDFISLSKSALDVSYEQLREFSKKEMPRLADLILARTRTIRLAQQIFMYGVPVVGWMAGFLCRDDYTFRSWNFAHRMRILRKAHGDDYFPYEELERVIGALCE